MPLIDSVIEKWRLWRISVVKSEENRRKICQQTHDDLRHKDCQKLAHSIWRTEGKPVDDMELYYLEAKKRLKGIRWLFYQLHKPFVCLEKEIIKPIDLWIEQASIFKIFSKISPIGILAIPVIIFIFNNQQSQRQQNLQAEIISAQADISHRKAVREYLSQITTIHLQSDEGEGLRKNKELQKLLEVNTIALFDELSLRGDGKQYLVSNGKLNWDLDPEAWKRDSKGQVVQLLFGLNWIGNLENQEPLISLKEANLSGANLSGANLNGIYLQDAILWSANIALANLSGANLSGANLISTNLSRANIASANLSLALLNQAHLSGANLSGANLLGADLFRADLSGANLENTEHLSNDQTKSACNWEQAIYTNAEFSFQQRRWITKNEKANQERIRVIKQDKASDPQKPSKC